MVLKVDLTELERKKLSDAGRDSIPRTNGWRPIETAPKDGTIIIGCQVDGDRVGISLVSWHKGNKTEGWVQSIGAEIKDGKRVESNWRLIGFDNLTHWHPLPKMPVSGT